MTDLEALRRLYFGTSRATIQRDFEQAIEIARRMPEEEREKAAVYLDGLSQLRAEWAGKRPRRKKAKREA